MDQIKQNKSLQMFLEQYFFINENIFSSKYKYFKNFSILFIFLTTFKNVFFVKEKIVFETFSQQYSD